MRKAEILKQRSLHRGDPQELALNFIVNYSAPARLMHSFLPQKKDPEDIFQAVIRAYIIGIAACVETFFRDLYFDLLRRNPILLQQRLNISNQKVPTKLIPQYLAEGVSAEELATEKASFQGAMAINQNLSVFFSNPFFETLDQFELICEIPSARRNMPCRLKLPESWQAELDRIFSLRHEFAHDANTRTQICPEEMQRLETTALMICQVSALLPAIRRRVIVGAKRIPVILLIADLTSDDWEIAEDGIALTMA